MEAVGAKDISLHVGPKDPIQASSLENIAREL